MQVYATAFSFKSQLTATHDREQAGLMRIRELKQALSTKKAKNKEPQGELSFSRAKLDVEKCARIQAEELSNAQKLHIKFVVVEHFKASANYHTELSKYTAAAYVKCISDMIKLMIERGIKATISVLTAVKSS